MCYTDSLKFVLVYLQNASVFKNSPNHRFKKYSKLPDNSREKRSVT
jgi:hypothetical protein